MRIALLSLLLTTTAHALPCVDGLLGSSPLAFLDATIRTAKIQNVEVGTFSNADLARGFLTQLTTIDKIADKIHKAGVATDPKVVFYPAAAHDSSTPLQLFPKAEVVVAVDWLPFLGPHAERPIRPILGKQAEAGHLLSNENQTLNGQAGLILGRLKMVLPKMRVLRVREATQTRPLVGTFSADRGVSHGLIEFDTGEGTPRQYYVHLQENLNDDNSKALEAWLKPLLEQGIDALLIKGSTTLADDAEITLARVLQSVRKRRGVLIEERLGLSANILIDPSLARETPLRELFGYRPGTLFQF